MAKNVVNVSYGYTAPTVVFVALRDFALAKSRLALMHAMRNKGWRVIAAAAPGESVDQLRGALVEFKAVGFRRGGFAPADIRSVRQLWHLYRSVRPRLVHHFNAKPVVYGGLAARFLEGAAVVNTVTGLGHGLDGRTVERFASRAAYRFIGSRADATIFQNAVDCDLFIERKWVTPKRARLVVSSGVDLGRFSEVGTSADECDGILMVTRLLWGKGVREFVEASRILRQRGHHIPLVLGGEWEFDHPDGVDRSFVEAAEREGSIEFRGYIDDMTAALANTAVVVAPSYYREGVARVLLEAGASGRPVVAADAPGAREVVCHGETGLLVPPQDPVALADAIEELLAVPERRRALGEAAYRYVADRFNLDAVTEQYLQVYRDIGALDGASPDDEHRVTGG